LASVVACVALHPWPAARHFAVCECDVHHRVELLRRINYATAAQNKVIGHCEIPLEIIKVVIAIRR
jgi:hypothetical protein